MSGDVGPETTVPGSSRDLLQHSEQIWKSLHTCKSTPVRGVSRQECIEILTTNSTNEPGLMIDVTAGGSAEDFGFNAQKERITNCIRYLKDYLGIDFLADGPQQMHFVYKSCPLDYFVIIIERKNNNQVVTSRIWINPHEEGKGDFDQSQRVELLDKEIKKYTDQIKDSTDVTPTNVEEEKRQLGLFTEALEQVRTKWRNIRLPHRSEFKYALVYNRSGYGTPLGVEGEISMDEVRVKVSASNELDGIEFRKPYDTETIKQIVKQRGLGESNEKIFVLLSSPDREGELVLIEGTNIDGEFVYVVSDLDVFPQFGASKSSVTAKAEASEEAINIMDDYLSDTDQKNGDKGAQVNVEMAPFTNEAGVNIQRDSILKKWNFVLGVSRFGYQIANNTFVEMGVVKDENGLARITLGDFLPNTTNGFYTESLERKLNRSTDPTYLANAHAEHTRCLFDVENQRGARFKGEIFPIERCGPNIQALLLNYSDKTQALEAGQVMFIPAENNNAALFIENFEGKLFVTQIEVLPTVKMSQETSSEFSVVYDYGRIFLDLHSNYQNGTLNE